MRGILDVPRWRCVLVDDCDLSLAYKAWCYQYLCLTLVLSISLFDPGVGCNLVATAVSHGSSVFMSQQFMPIEALHGV
jgi:hypothetical protein